MAAGGRGSVKDKEKLKIVLINLIRNLKEVKYKTELIKLSFLLDYLYCKEFSTKEGPTTVEYVKYNYGPYSDAFIDAFNELVQEGILTEVQLTFGLGYSIVKDNKKDVDENTGKILRRVLDGYGRKTLREVKDVIYNTQEFKSASFGKAIALNG